MLTYDTSRMVATFTTEDDDGNEKEHELACHFEICSVCNGKGSHSLRFGAITQEDRDNDWDPESFSEYMRGGYDERCIPCEGSGKVLVPTESTSASYKLYRQIQEDDADFEAVSAAEWRAEHGPGAGEYPYWNRRR